MDNNSTQDKKSDLQTLKEAGSALKEKYYGLVENKPTLKKVNSGLFVLLKWIFIIVILLLLRIIYVAYENNQNTVKIPNVKIPTINLNALSN